LDETDNNDAVNDTYADFGDDISDNSDDVDPSATVEEYDSEDDATPKAKSSNMLHSSSKKTSGVSPKAIQSSAPT